MPSARSTVHQTAFLGGEWNPSAQGRSDLPTYKMAMNLSLNGLPVEEGSWTRRPGFQWTAWTRGRTTAKLLPFLSSENTPILCEFTNTALRFHYGTGQVYTNDRRVINNSVLASGDLTLTLDAVHGWSVGDFVRIALAPSISASSGPGALLNRTFKITAAPTTSKITLRDDLGVALTQPDALDDDILATSKVMRLKEYTSLSYATADLPGIRLVQEDTQAFILSASVFPRVLTITAEAASADADQTFTFAAAAFTDGPYLDAQPDTATVSAYTGSITLTPASTTFTASDVGRLVRLWSQPPDWSSATTYTYGQTATYGGAFWKSIATGTHASQNVNIVPGSVPELSDGVALALWAPAPTEGRWAWGTITAQATTSCTVLLTTDLNSANGATISEWRLGLFTTGSYPTCGVYHEGRLHLGGAVGNRGDASVSNDVLNFSPSDIYGVVDDSSAISYTLNAKDTNQFYWMEPDHQGILIGTAGGEWLLAASNLNDPLTPTSRQAHRVTRYRAKNVEPRRAGMALIFVQLFGRRLMEYLADTFSGRFSGKHVNRQAKHLSLNGLAEVQYQEETTPVLWCRTEENALIGDTYRRDSRYVTEDPEFTAWHKHTLGGSYTVASMAMLPGLDGINDKLFACTVDPATGYYSVEVLTPLFEDMQ